MFVGGVVGRMFKSDGIADETFGDSNATDARPEKEPSSVALKSLVELKEFTVLDGKGVEEVWSVAVDVVDVVLNKVVSAVGTVNVDVTGTLITVDVELDVRVVDVMDEELVEVTLDVRKPVYPVILT